MKTHLEPIMVPIVHIDSVQVSIDTSVVMKEVKLVGTVLYWPMIVAFGALCILMAYEICENHFFLIAH